MIRQAIRHMARGSTTGLIGSNWTSGYRKVRLFWGGAHRCARHEHRLFRKAAGRERLMGL
jgi:hypothetical protein